MANVLVFDLHPLATEAANGTGEAIDIGATRSCVKLSVSLDDLTGAGASLAVTVETSPTGTGRWRQAGSAIGANGDAKIVGKLDRFVRASWKIGGTPPVSLAFSVPCEAHTLYASPADVRRLSLPEKALSSIHEDVMLDHCLAASDEAEGYLGGRYTLPLTAWSSDLRRHVASMAAATAMKFRGFQPGGTDELILKGQDDAVSWLTKIARHVLEPPGILDSTPTVYEGGVSVVSGGTNEGDYWP